jgi:hypothetical protein
MRVGDLVSDVSGCITKEKFIAGRTLAEIERILGFHAGRFSRGIIVVALTDLPCNFDLAAYSNVAKHRHSAPTGLDIAKIKADVVKTWSTCGFERLVKVRPLIPHNQNMSPDLQYPPGYGAPQWNSRDLLRGKIVGVVADYPFGRYVVADVVRW